MPKYRKKPVVIEAIQWDGTYTGMESIIAYFTNLKSSSCSWHPIHNTVSNWSILTLEGSHEVSKGDFIIKGIKDEYYPCKSDIFEATYEKVLE